MVFTNLPPNFSEEEEALRLKYAKLRKKKKTLQALKAAKPEKEQVKDQPIKRTAESADDAKEQVKKLLKSGAIRIQEKHEKHNFKRSRILEKKLQDPEKSTTAVGFQPFSATHPEEEREDKAEDFERRPRGRMRGLYENFVKGERLDSNDERRERPERDKEPPKKGHTVYVRGFGISEDILRKAFSNIGTIVNINLEASRHCGFVTFDKMESADLAIQEVNGGMIEGVQMQVSMARRQPSFDQVNQDPSSTSWSSIASSNSQKGSHKDKRDIVEYDENIF
ncbi:hypothetical protein ACJMK2_038656 [Sinanodonta woodiana]|uniref:Negative elongation factor E n=1 Tax=Sinanodonta woodiana TaxID=1069815 RepID=A0ABD3WD15_SINWO